MLPIVLKALKSVKGAPFLQLTNASTKMFVKNIYHNYRMIIHQPLFNSIADIIAVFFNLFISAQVDLLIFSEILICLFNYMI